MVRWSFSPVVSLRLDCMCNIYLIENTVSAVSSIQGPICSADLRRKETNKKKTLWSENRRKIKQLRVTLNQTLGSWLELSVLWAIYNNRIITIFCLITPKIPLDDFWLRQMFKAKGHKLYTGIAIYSTSYIVPGYHELEYYICKQALVHILNLHYTMMLSIKQHSSGQPSL